MWIKRLRVEGFKSFGDENIIDFHRHVNVVLGRNGSGKSNLFSAISLLLNASVVPSREKVHLIHDASARHQATVELTFDNSDGRLPVVSAASKTGRTETVIKRVIGAKSDIYYINAKPVTRGEIISLMEAAGFSRNNPFYLVEQGQVSDLANCSESKRLKVVQDLAGLSSFDEKQANAITLLKDAKRSSESAHEELDGLSGELEDLKGKEGDVNKVVDAMERKRVLDWVRIEKIQSEIHRRLSNTVSMKNEELLSLTATRRKLHKKKEEKTVASRDVDYAEDDVSVHYARRIELQDGREIELGREAQQHSELKQLDVELQESKMQQQDCKDKFDELNQKIKVAQIELATLNDKLSAAQQASFNASSDLRIKQKMQNNIFARRTRLENFRSEEEMKEFVGSQITEVKADISAKLSKKEILTKEKEAELSEEKTTLQDISELEEALKNHLELTSETVMEVAKTEPKTLDIAARERNNRKILLDRIESLRETCNLQQEVRLKKIRDKRVRPFIIGGESMKEILSITGVSTGFHGFVGELFQNDPSLNTAISVVLGPKLYFMVVETAALGHRLLKEMRNFHLPGEVSFLALDKLKVWPSPEVPPDSTNAKPLLSLIKFEERFSSVFQFIFGQTILVKSMNDFYQFRGTRWNCVTMDGQQKFSSGVLKGGSYPAGEETHLHLFRRYVEIDVRVNELKESKTLSERELEELEIELKKARDDVTRKKTKIDRLHRKILDVRGSIDVCMKKIPLMRRLIEEKTSDIHSLEVDLKELEAAKDDLQSEFNGLPLSDRDCKNLAKDIEYFIGQSKDTFFTRNSLEKKRNSLRTQLDTWTQNLSTLASDIEMFDSSRMPLMKSRIDMIQLENAGTESSLENFKLSLDKIDLVIQQACEKKLQCQAMLEDLISKCDQLKRTEQDHDDTFKELELKEAGLNRKALDLQEEAALLPAPKDSHLIGEARDMSKKEMYSKLKTLTKVLAKYQERGIDAGILEHIKERCEKMELFNKRLTSCQSEILRVQMLSDEIRMKRSQKVEFTYNQMKKNFKDIFAVLVPGGCGGLTFVYPSERCLESSSSSSQCSQTNEPIGISFKVRFGSSTCDPVSDTSQLSGGQKALIAIAFILAVHRCDPVPFYVMDEVDAALDDDHRARVIKLMSEHNDAQFICATFRKEFILRSDHFIEVKYTGQASRVSSIDGMEEAIKLINDNGEENPDE